MRKVNKGIVALVLLLLLCILGSSCPLTSQEVHKEVIELDGFKITLSEPEIEFPSSITFNIEVESDTLISEIKLQYQVDRLSPFPITSVAFPEFEPGTSVKTSWTLDLTQFGGLPPGTELDFWWSIVDQQGNSVDTSPDELLFDDMRYSWKSLTSDDGKITLFWYRGSDSFARSLIGAAQQARSRLAEDIGAELEGEATLYIYANQQDLLGAMVYPQEWTGGVAYTEFDTIAIGISTGDIAWGKRTIAHELAHLVVHQVIFSGYGVELPTWLDEGLAQYTEGESEFEYILEQAIDDDGLFSVKSLCSPFPAQTNEALLAYAQSYSLIEYLLEEQGDEEQSGSEKIRDLLYAFKGGSGYVEALDEVYSLDIEQLDALWRDYVSA